jgi:hypothetical protein
VATKSGGLFAAYIDNSLQLKQEASGYPHGCESEEQKDDYIKKYEETNGSIEVENYYLIFRF